jgi:hypothetical protein
MCLLLLSILMKLSALWHWSTAASVTGAIAKGARVMLSDWLAIIIPSFPLWICGSYTERCCGAFATSNWLGTIGLTKPH